MKWELPEVPKYKVPDELKIYGEGACFMIVRKDGSDPDSELVFIHAYTAAVESQPRLPSYVGKTKAEVPDVVIPDEFFK